MARTVREPAPDAPEARPVGPISQRIGQPAAPTGERPASASDETPAAAPDGTPAAASDEAAAPAPGSAAPVSVPDIPKLSDGVHLSGDMEESAFVEPQWLVQRDGQFVQLTELLYRVAEQIDGQKDLATIAEAVGEAIDRDVTDENVRQLIAEKLIPLGLVQGADGQVVKPASAGRSLLQVNAKMAMIPDDVSQGLGRALSFLYWPPLLIVVLAAAFAAQAWLYVTHGIGGSVHDVLYQPQLLLAILGVIVIATGFHELGHAAALVYGGGKVRGMGAGMYLIYPAFYTDVTDNYRLGRWARVRTDLGGIYFNLIFAAGIVALYIATGWEFLLASVILLNVQTVQQLLPFVRLDGYWILADITGIPDFFTHMGGFLRSVLPIKAWRGAKLPELKWWGKAVFAAYIALVIPLLAFMVFVAIKSFPRLAATTWDSFQKQIVQLSASFAAGDLLGALGTAVGIVLLGLPALGIVYMFWSLGKALVTKLWAWSDDDVRKRVVAMAGLGAAALALAVLWTPRIPGTEQPGPLYAASGDWTPIAPNERGTVGDFVAGEVAYAPLAETRPSVAIARATEIALAGTPSATPLATTLALATGTPAAEATATVATTPSDALARQTPGAVATTTPGAALATGTASPGSPTPDATSAATTGTAAPTFAAPSPTSGAASTADGTTASAPTATIASTPSSAAPTAAPTSTPVPAAPAPTTAPPPPTAPPAPTSTPVPASGTGGGTAPATATATAAPPTATAATTTTTTPGPGTPTATPGPGTPAATPNAATGSTAATGTPTR